MGGPQRRNRPAGPRIIQNSFGDPVLTPFDKLRMSGEPINSPSSLRRKPEPRRKFTDSQCQHFGEHTGFRLSPERQSPQTLDTRNSQAPSVSKCPNTQPSYHIGTRCNYPEGMTYHPLATSPGQQYHALRMARAHFIWVRTNHVRISHLSGRNRRLYASSRPVPTGRFANA